MYNQYYNTTTVSELSEITKNSYEGRINPIKLKPNEINGPYFRVDGPDWEPSKRSSSGRYCGTIRPLNKNEAERLYKISMSKNNPITHVHKFYFITGQSVNKPIIFQGKTDGGTEIQSKFNNECVDYIVRKTVFKLD